MRGLLIAVVAAALSVPTAAHAAAEPLPGGSCGFVSWSPLDDGTQTAVVSSDVIAAADITGDPLANPVSLTVHCTVYVQGAWPDPAAHASGSGVVVAAVPPTLATFAATGSDVVYLCTHAVLTDAFGATTTYYQNTSNGMWGAWPACDAGTCTSVDENCNTTYAFLHWTLTRLKTVACPQVAAQPDAYAACLALPTRWNDIVDGAFDRVGEAWAVVEPQVCAALASRAPGAGPVEIRADGDVYVAGEFIWDCPPYEFR